MYWTSSSIVRRPVDATFAREMRAAVADVAQEKELTDVLKPVKYCNLSILSARQISFASRQAGDSFDAAVAAGELLEATECSVLNPVSAIITSIEFKKAHEQELRLLAFMSADGVENEASIAHSLLSEQSLTEFPYLPGVHISFGRILGDFSLRDQSRFLEELSDKYVGSEIKLEQATLCELRALDYQVTYTDLADIATNSIATQLEMRCQNGPLFN